MSLNDGFVACRLNDRELKAFKDLAETKRLNQSDLLRWLIASASDLLDHRRVELEELNKKVDGLTSDLATIKRQVSCLVKQSKINA